MAHPTPALAVIWLIGGLWLTPVAALAQVQQFLLGPGSNVGPETQVKPKDCVTAPDGSVTCNTQLVNPPGTTEAKPIYSPWDK
jgi:hypothetical protein